MVGLLSPDKRHDIQRDSRWDFIHPGGHLWHREKVWSPQVQAKGRELRGHWQLLLSRYLPPRLRSREAQEKRLTSDLWLGRAQ